MNIKKEKYSDNLSWSVDNLNNEGFKIIMNFIQLRFVIKKYKNK